MKGINEVMKVIGKNGDFKVEIKDCPVCGTKKSLKILYEKGEKVSEHCFNCEDMQLARKIQHEAKMQKLKNLQRFFDQNSLINNDLKNATMENYEPQNESQRIAKEEFIRYAKEFPSDPPKNLIAVGSYGVGKSHLAKSCGDLVMQKGFTSLFISTPRLLTKIKSTYGKKSEVKEENLINMLIDVDLLILDDIGAESKNDNDEDEKDTWVTGKLFEIIDGRQGKSTIYTTNYSSTELKKRLNIRLLERIMHKTKPIKMDGESYRMPIF